MFRPLSFILLIVASCFTLTCPADHFFTYPKNGAIEDFRLGLLDQLCGKNPRAEGTRRRALRDLETIRSIFSVKYGPALWKKEYVGWDLDQEIDKAKEAIAQLEELTLKDCQVIIRDFFRSTKDYHVSVQFYSTELACLPFDIFSAEGRYFVTHVDKHANPAQYPLKVGDEILEFDGRPIDEVVQQLRFQEYGDNRYLTDLHLAEECLTFRKGREGNRVPKGLVRIRAKRKATGQTIDVLERWVYLPEEIRDIATLDKPETQQMLFDVRHSDPYDRSRYTMTSGFWEKRALDSRAILGFSAHPFSVGARESYVPELGKKLWQTSKTEFFNAYIFETIDEKRIGYVRIPDYSCSNPEASEFRALINYFEQETDALVIDQINNPGGEASFVLALISMFASHPFETPTHHFTLTQKEVFEAIITDSRWSSIKSTREAKEIIGEYWNGYPVDYSFVQKCRRFCQTLVKEWNCGKFYTDALHLLGIDKVKPNRLGCYTKPVLILINNLDFSAADFFPALMQDNKRAILLGSTTAGAGGCVEKVVFPNQTGIDYFKYTSTFAHRPNGEPIENLGVVPDVPYELTVNDLQNGFVDYKAKILETLNQMIQQEEVKDAA